MHLHPGKIFFLITIPKRLRAFVNVHTTIFLPLFMRNTNRNCIQCEGPIEGRANKKFCSNACRAQHFRDNPTEMADTTTQVKLPILHKSTLQPNLPFIGKASLMSLADEEDDDTEDDYVRRARERKEKEAIEAGIKLDVRYKKMINECLKADGTYFNDDDDDELQTWLDEIDELIANYHCHPGLHLSSSYTHQCLEDLYWMRDKFNRLLVKWVEQPSSWRYGVEPVYFEMSAKRKKLLRAHLLLKS